MSELKTLKDLKEKMSKEIMSGSCHDRVNETFEEIRQEFIKWAKDAKEYNHKMTQEDFEDFFNITEEELKEDKTED